MASDTSVFRRNIRSILKWTIYALLLLAAYIAGQNPFVLNLFGVRPILILPVAISVAMFEHEFSGAIFAAAAGILWGISSDTVFGYYAIILLVLGAAAGLICSYGLSPNLLTALLLSFGASMITGLLDFFFLYVLWGYNGLSRFFLTSMLPTILVTAFFIIPFYYLVRLINGKLQLPK
ncbi:hypothetical protein [Acetanaerobacterium elongatum]|uniref:Rod shape-determining protein MreD n=1 Tax=Acetanaerobacterium elongatum TaxID=258515 RepID=A0A1H0CHZ0_9FIRM|nr:hypothetical protein [Acetanaerobacterium elongatum]SDN57472.1 hypothetical protein SAMN05192585_12334 [Acetanaerobacterium elongatum]